MPQPMTPAPDASEGMEALKKWLQEKSLGGAKMAAGMVAPVPDSPLSALIAGLRTFKPGGGSFRQEMDRYREGYAPDDSVMDKHALPGEDQFAFMQRENAAPHVQREVMAGASMAAPIVVHASPVKWAGQPTRSRAGSGEGGAAYGEGLYGSIPANAKGIDARYRQNPSTHSGYQDLVAPDRQVHYDGKPMADDWSTGEGMANTILHEIMAEVGASSRAKEVALRRMSGVVDNLSIVGDPKRVEVGRQAIEYVKGLDPEKLEFRAFTPGSFHVWDVPDTLLDWDAPMAGQDPSVAGALQKAGLMPEVKPLSQIPRESWPFGSHPDDSAVMVGGKPAMRAASSFDASQLTGRDLSRAVGETYPGTKPGQGPEQYAGEALKEQGITGHRYLGEAGSSGEALGVPNFVIYDDAAVKPLGTFNSADEFLSSPLYKQLEPRIKQEQAALVERYPHLKSYFGME